MCVKPPKYPLFRTCQTLLSSPLHLRNAKLLDYFVCIFAVGLKFLKLSEFPAVKNKVL